MTINVCDNVTPAAPDIGFRIRRADENLDWRALRLLLPDAIYHGCGCDAFVATDDERQRRIIGAIAVAPTFRLQPRRGSKVSLHVIAPWRLRGVARELRAVACRMASARGMDALYAWSPVKPDGGDAQLWRALGFDQVIDCPLHRIDATQTVELLQPLIARLTQRRHIPAAARIVYLHEAKIDQIVELATTHLAHVGEPLRLKNRLLGNHPQPLDPILSRVLMFGERVAGVILGRPLNSQVVVVDANVVHPSVRGGWANLWLKLDAASRARDLGFTTFLYETYQQHADTAKLTARLQGAVEPRVELYHIIEPSLR